MLLSIIIPGKNDNFRKNTLQVLKFNLQQTINNINYLNINDIELVLCDWGSDVKIIDAIELDKYENFRCVYVPPEITEKYNNGASYSVVHTLNSAFRRTRGKYVIFWDSDCFVPLESFQNLYKFVKRMNESNDMSFYWASRFDINYNEYKSFTSTEELDIYLKNKPPIEIKFNPVNGCASALLMNRSLWHSSTGWWEVLTYWGWQDIEYHNRLLQRYNYGGDLNDFGVSIYHLTCNEYGNNRGHFFINPQINSLTFECNDSNWGLNNEKLEII